MQKRSGKILQGTNYIAVKIRQGLLSRIRPSQLVCQGVSPCYKEKGLKSPETAAATPPSLELGGVHSGRHVSIPFLGHLLFTNWVMYEIKCPMII